MIFNEKSIPRTPIYVIEDKCPAFHSPASPIEISEMPYGPSSKEKSRAPSSKKRNEKVLQDRVEPQKQKKTKLLRAIP